MQEDIESIRKDLSNMINNMAQLAASEMPAKMRKIESRFDELRTAVGELDDNIMMFDDSERNDAKKFLIESKSDIKKLENAYIEAKNKGSQRDALFGNAIRADGSSAGQLNSLVDQNSLIEEGNDLTTELARSANQGKEAGVSIISELQRQRGVIDHVSEELDTLDTDIETGDQKITSMLCRNKRRTIFMIIIILILVVAIGFFLYFIFKK